MKIGTSLEGLAMFKQAVFALILCCGLGHIATAQTGTVQFKKADIMDNTGFKAPVRYAVSLVPANWSTTGGVVWNVDPASCTAGARTAWYAASPDGGTEMGMLPGIGWQGSSLSGWSQNQGCIVPQSRNPDDAAAAYVQQIAQMTGTQLNIVDIAHDAGWDRQLTQLYSGLSYRTPDFSTEYSAYTRVAEFSFVADNKPIRGFLIMNMLYIDGQTGGFNSNSGQIYQAFFLTAPADKFGSSVPLFEAFMRNFQEDPAWQIAKWNSDAEYARNNPKPSSNWSVSTVGSDILDIQMKGYNDRNAIRDAGHANTIDTIRGVTTYAADTPTGQVQIPTHFENAWQLPNGNIVATNDAFYNGNGEGTRLENFRQ